MDDLSTFELTKPITIFRIPCRLQNTTLKVYELPRLAMLIGLLSCITGSAAIFMREPVLHNGINIRLLPILAIFSTFVSYSVMFTNLSMGGWGASDSRFWCDVRIMFVRGFNTVRTFGKFSASTLLFVFAALLLQVNEGLLFLCLLIILAEWQAGVSENQNQYDQSLFEKFIGEDGKLCLESLNLYQFQHPHQSVSWSPFIVHCLIKTWVVSSLFWMATFSDTIFLIPQVLCILLWCYFVPLILDLMYFQNICTFCQLETYRIVMDSTLLPLILMFALV